MEKVICNSIGGSAECENCGASKLHVKSCCEPCPFVEGAKCIVVKADIVKKEKTEIVNLKIKEVSKIINLDASTIRNYITRGVISDEYDPESKQCFDLKYRAKLKAHKVKVGMQHEWRVLSSDLDKFVLDYLT
jgi:hypothetical protein